MADYGYHKDFEYRTTDSTNATTTYSKTYVVGDLYYTSVESALKGAGDVIQTLKYEIDVLKSEVYAFRAVHNTLFAEIENGKKHTGTALAHSVGCNPEHLPKVVKEFWDTILSYDPEKMVEHMENIVRKHEEAI